MVTGKFSATVRRQAGIAIIDLSGEIDRGAEAGLDDAYTAAEQDRPAAILLNFTHVDYMNSTGIALIVGLLKRAQNAHLHLMACGLSEHYTEIFKITRLSDFVEIVPDEAHALAASSTVAEG